MLARPHGVREIALLARHSLDMTMAANPGARHDAATTAAAIRMTSVTALPITSTLLGEGAPSSTLPRYRHAE